MNQSDIKLYQCAIGGLIKTKHIEFRALSGIEILTNCHQAMAGITMSNQNIQIRTIPPSNTANNQDVFLWAIYVLGGADRDIDVEDIYLKCFEMAPARLGWRTQPQLPDYKKTSKALQSVEASTHVGLIHRPHQYSRRLTIEGIRWIEAYKEILERVYSKQTVAASANTNMYERTRQSIKESGSWQLFQSDPTLLDIADLAALLRCTATSPQETWRSRILDLKRAAEVLDDKELAEFARVVDFKVIKGDKSNDR